LLLFLKKVWKFNEDLIWHVDNSIVYFYNYNIMGVRIPDISTNEILQDIVKEKGKTLDFKEITKIVCDKVTQIRDELKTDPEKVWIYWAYIETRTKLLKICKRKKINIKCEL